MRRILLSVLLSALVSAPAVAADGDKPAVPAQPPVFQQLLDCKPLSDPSARLACFDRQVAALEAASAAKEIVIADKAQVREARRGLFGFAAPIGKLLGMGSDSEPDQEGISRLETTVSQVWRSREGALKLKFADGGTWEQTDRYGFPLTPRVGNPVLVTKGAVGSYFVSVDGMAGIKMRRVE